MDCKTCKDNRKEPVPYIVHEGAMARQERTNKRLFIIVVCLVVLLAGCIASAVVANKARIDAINELRELERSIETVYEYDVEQEADNNGSNYVVGGDFNGEAEN